LLKGRVEVTPFEWRSRVRLGIVGIDTRDWHCFSALISFFFR
jgi:hypothetical protein